MFCGMNQGGMVLGIAIFSCTSVSESPYCLPGVSPDGCCQPAEVGSFSEWDMNFRLPRIGIVVMGGIGQDLAFILPPTGEKHSRPWGPRL